METFYNVSVFVIRTSTRYITLRPDRGTPKLGLRPLLDRQQLLPLVDGLYFC